ncbi:MAG TPA: sigma 54-dependent Fis family transcriptional regulator [Minicystis sp.]|nr:sigma 54-dependent Fis family transcriptional regulator [Minicystis sp.]
MGERDFETSTAVLDRDGKLKVRCRTLRIDVVSGPSAGLSRELPGPAARVGSGPGQDLVLADPAVSRHHLTLRIDDLGVRVVDAGSRNGTWLDGTRVLEAYARPDSSIAIGNSVLRLRLGTGYVELPLSPREAFGALLGQSVAMRQVFTVLERVAPTAETVLVLGETGTGKELVAEAIHEESPRASGPFIVFDCSAVAPTLVESELFGHVRGAFTGAVEGRAGAFEEADGGTLFLDEIGELPLELQPKLLRALERREVRRVGANVAKKVDVRIVAATHRNLEELVSRGVFREDLYYRLAVVTVHLPPLRERPEDIPLLARHFARQLARGAPAAELPERTLAAFAGQAFPGNVRELRNAVARALSLGVLPGGGDERRASAPSLASPFAVDLSVPLKVARDRIDEAFEREYVAQALEETGGNVSRAAELAGVNRKFIQRAIKRHGLRGGGAKPGEGT